MTRCVSCKSEDGFWTDEDRNPACQPCRDAPKHKYFLLNRPPGFATIPDGWFSYEAWMPGRVVSLDREWHVLGWVEYTAPLEPEQVWKWELLPLDGNERDEWRDKR